MNIIETLNDVKGFLNKLPIEDVRFVMMLHDKWFMNDDENIIKMRKQVNEDDKNSMIKWLVGTNPIVERGGFLDFINSIGDV